VPWRQQVVALTVILVMVFVVFVKEEEIACEWVLIWMRVVEVDTDANSS
jgi:hypothetical protein